MGWSSYKTERRVEYVTCMYMSILPGSVPILFLVPNGRSVNIQYI